MPSLEEMKRIADARTKGEWVYCTDTLRHWIERYDRHFIGVTGCQPADVLFTAMAANNWDKIMAVVEAAKLSVINIKNGINVGVYRHLGNGDVAIDGDNWHLLNNALEALEKD